MRSAALVLAALSLAGVTSERASAAYTYSLEWDLRRPSGPGPYTADGLSTADPAIVAMAGTLDGTYTYEVKSVVKTIGLYALYGGCFFHYLRASNDASYPGNTGTFYAVRVCQTFPATVSAVYIVKRVGGVTTTLAQAQSVWLDGMSIRTTMLAENSVRVFIDDHYVAEAYDSSIASGSPGIGTSGGGGGAYMVSASFGLIDHVAPPGFSARTIRATATGSSVELAWDAAQDDAVGIGIWRYQVKRDGAYLGETNDPTFYDGTVAAGQAYQYTICALDFHGNGYGAGALVHVAVPGAGSIDARQVGVRPLGTYWGTAGEQIDLRSGNLNYTVPLLTAKGRNGKDVTFGLNYNSQIWRADNGETWGWERMWGTGTGGD
jgi:hypothetical protein